MTTHTLRSLKASTAVAVSAGVLIAATAVIILLVLPSTTRTTLPAQLCRGTASCITGTVTNIVDGDTLDVGEFRVRLALVNTPEVNEAGYEEAKQFTANLCQVGSKAVIDEDDGQPEGSFGRMIAKVSCGEKVLNAELLNAGLAEILPEFCAKSEFKEDDWARQHGC